MLKSKIKYIEALSEIHKPQPEMVRRPGTTMKHTPILSCFFKHETPSYGGAL